MKPNDGTLRERDEQLRQDVVTLDLSRYTETMFSKMDAMDKSTFNILVQIARDAARVETLHQVNAIFCQGLSSSLSLEFMRDMMERSVRAEQREASAGLIYELAHSMAERGLFVRDDFGEPNIYAIREIVAAIRSQR